MLITVDHLDAGGLVSKLPEDVSYLAFLKHFAIAGQGYLPSVPKFLRMLGSFCWFFDYMDPSAFRLGRFGHPPADRYDPSAQAQFSNLAGKAIADLLAKRIDRAHVTFGYEAAMVLAGFAIKKSRPDLYCIGRNRQFAVEAKGLSRRRIHAAEMATFKGQAMSGPLPVHFSVASVAYDFYRSPKCKYHDPINERVEYAELLNTRLLQQYYDAWDEFSKSSLFRLSEDKFGERIFVVLEPDVEKAMWLRPSPFLAHLRWIIDPRVLKVAPIQVVETQDFAYESPDTYVDSDGIGLTARFREDGLNPFSA